MRPMKSLSIAPRWVLRRSRMLVDFRRLLPCVERFYVFSALLPANMQAALSGRKVRPECIDEANAGYLITNCMLVARGAARAISTELRLRNEFLYPQEPIANNRRMNGASLVSDGQFSRSGSRDCRSGPCGG